MTPQEIMSKLISNLVSSIELAPAVKKDPDALIDLTNVAEEFRVASRMIRGLEPPIPEIAGVPVEATLDEHVEYVRGVLQETVGNYQAVSPERLNEYTSAGLLGMLGASEEALGTIQTYV